MNKVIQFPLSDSVEIISSFGRDITEPQPPGKEFLINRMAEKLILISENDEIQPEIKNALLAIADSVIDESNCNADTGAYLRANFARAMFCVSEDYADAVLQTLNCVMENCIDDEIYSPIVEKTLGR